ncbi:hypothetical protein, partial [Pseudomonas sp. HY13-MNA-CIBAN-0226]
GEKVTAAVIEQIEPTVKAANSILVDYEKAKMDKIVAEDSYDTLKQLAEPYLMAIQGLNQEEIARVNEVMQLESRKIAIERVKYERARYLSK